MECPTLRNLYVYITNRCNLRCRHCWISAGGTSEKHLSFGEVKACVEQAMPLGLKSVKFTGGEPLIREEIVPLIRWSHEQGLRISLETNGVALDDEIAVTLSACAVRTSVSIDSARAEEHDAFRGVIGAYEGAMAGIHLLVKHGVRPEIIMSVHRANVNEIERVAELATSLRARALKLNVVQSLGRAVDMKTEGALLTTPEVLALVPKMAEYSDRYRMHVNIDVPIVFKPLRTIKGRIGTCPSTTLISILEDGRLAFCGYGQQSSSFELGHIAHDRIADIWQDHPLLVEMRRVVPDKLEGVCQRCMVRAYCRGYCRVASYAAYQSLSAPMPICQDAWDLGLFPENRLVPKEFVKC